MRWLTAEGVTWSQRAAASNVPSATAALNALMSLEPAVAALAGFLLLGQGLSARELAGIALVVAASLGASRRARRAAR